MAIGLIAGRHLSTWFGSFLPSSVTIPCHRQASRKAIYRNQLQGDLGNGGAATVLEYRMLLTEPFESWLLDSGVRSN